MRDQTARDLIDYLRREIKRLDRQIVELRMDLKYNVPTDDEFDALLEYLKLERKPIERHIEFVPKVEE